MAVDRFPIEASHILMFARAVGDDNQIYYDADYAAGTECGTAQDTAGRPNTTCAMRGLVTPADGPYNTVSAPVRSIAASGSIDRNSLHGTAWLFSSMSEKI